MQFETKEGRMPNTNNYIAVELMARFFFNKFYF